MRISLCQNIYKTDSITNYTNDGGHIKEYSFKHYNENKYENNKQNKERKKNYMRCKHHLRYKRACIHKTKDIKRRT